MPHHLMRRHLSPLKNNSKIEQKTHHVTAPFFIKNNYKNSSSMPHHLSLLIFLKKIQGA
jgi:hypothetical protein